MELLLERTDLVQVGTVSYRNTMKLISGGKSGRQRLVVGDDHGYVECFEIKKGEPQSVFKQRVSTEGPVMALAIGGVAGKNDRVFAARAQTIVGLKRKGAQCFKMQSSLVEPIHHMAVDESLLFTGCEYVYNRYDDGRDDGFFMCHDKINAMVVRPKPGGGGHRVVLGCQDRCVRVVVGSELEREMKMDAPVTALCLYRGPEGGAGPAAADGEHADLVAAAQDPAALEVCFGTESGGVGLLRIGSEGKYSGVVWHVEDTKALHSRVNCIDVFDVTHDGIPDVVVGRADGRVQVYSFDVSPVPLVQFEANLNEAIHSLCCGSVSSTGFDEIVCCTFAGRVASFSNEPLREPRSPGRGGAPGKTVAEDRTDNRLAALKEDVAALAKKIERERARFQDLDAPFAPCCAEFNHWFGWS
jgi:Bardet-Biedl syndrome 7 protein